MRAANPGFVVWNYTREKEEACPGELLPKCETGGGKQRSTEGILTVILVLCWQTCCRVTAKGGFEDE